MDEVGGAVDGVDDPGGIIGQNAGSARRYRLLTDEAERRKTSAGWKISAV